MGCCVSPASCTWPGREHELHSVGGMTSDRPCPPKLLGFMPDVTPKVLGGQRGGVGCCSQAGPLSLWGCTIGFGEWEVSGPESLGPVLIWPQLISGVISSVPARVRVKLKVFWGLLSCTGQPPPSQLVLHVALLVPTDRRGQRLRAAVQGLFFVVMVGLVHLSICVIQRGSNSHGFWSGSGGPEGVPLLSPRH